MGFSQIARTVVIALSVAGCTAAMTSACRNRDKQTMKDEYARLMNYSQLFRPPAASSEVLDSVAKGTTSLNHPQEELVATDTARDFLRYVLREHYLPPAETPFVPFASEQGAYDVVRTRYVVDSSRIDIASTICVISITVSTQPGGSTTCAERATNLLLTMFTTKTPIRLVEVGREGDMSFGRQGRAPTTEYAFWEDALRWWCTASQVGFLTLTTEGGPTSLTYSFDPGSNRAWFKFHKRTKPPRARTEE